MNFMNQLVAPLRGTLVQSSVGSRGLEVLARIGDSIRSSSNWWLMHSLSGRVNCYEPGLDPCRAGNESPSVLDADVESAPRFYLVYEEYLPILRHFRPSQTSVIGSEVETAAALVAFSPLPRGFGGDEAFAELSQRVRSTNSQFVNLIPVGIGLHKPLRFNKNERVQVIPRPYSRLRVIFGPTTILDLNGSVEVVESARTEALQRLRRLTLEAEAWANSSAPKQGESTFRRETAAAATTTERRVSSAATRKAA